MGEKQPPLVLPVNQPQASQLVRGKTRQISRCFPCEPQFIGRWVAIQATEEVCDPLSSLLSSWSIVGIGKLSGVGYHPGFCLDPEHHLGRAHKKLKGHAGPWIWTFSHLQELEAIPLNRQPEARGAYREQPEGPLYWVDDGDGGPWSCCPRVLPSGIVTSVREAHRKVRAA